MTWVRVHPYVANWPGGGPPPVFEINSDENGSAVIELAWDPQALLAPASYDDPLRYYSSDQPFSASVQRAGGGTLSVSVPAVPITLTGNHATWVMPADLWAGYLEESLNSVSTPRTTTFSGNIYYRVRLTAPGATSATIWPGDSLLQIGAAALAPHIGVLPVSAPVSSQIFPDDAAIDAMGGITELPTLFSDMLRNLWAGLPTTDTDRKALAETFAHPTFLSAPVTMRSDILKLWLFAGRSRSRIPLLLSREVVTGSNLTTPIIDKLAYKGGKNLVQNLLDLMYATPHPDLGAIRRDQIVDDVVHEIVDPNGQANQGGAGLCVPTSIQAFLINVNPAEYARLQVGWLSSTGSAELADGSTATVPTGILQIARYSTNIALPGGQVFQPNNTGFLFRTYSEMAFQGAMLKFGEGASFPSSDGSEAQTRQVFQHVYAGGLNQSETKVVLDGLFGVTFRTSAMAWPVGPGLAAKQSTIQAAFLADMSAHPRALLLAVYWRTPPSTPVPPHVNAATFFSTHAVVPIRHDGGRVIFKNPQYAGSAPVPAAVAGGFNVNPPRRYEDPSASLESITDSDLTNWIYWYVVSDSALI